MNITDLKQNDICIAMLEGRLDAAGAPLVEAHCQELMAGGCTRLLIDMDKVEYISSAGLRSLLVLAKASKAANGKMVLCNLAPMVVEVMEISGFDKLLLLADDRDAAVEQIK